MVRLSHLLLTKHSISSPNTYMVWVRLSCCDLALGKSYNCPGAGPPDHKLGVNIPVSVLAAIMTLNDQQ